MLSGSDQTSQVSMHNPAQNQDIPSENPTLEALHICRGGKKENIFSHSHWNETPEVLSRCNRYRSVLRLQMLSTLKLSFRKLAKILHLPISLPTRKVQPEGWEMKFAMEIEKIRGGNYQIRGQNQQILRRNAFSCNVNPSDQ